MKKENDHFTPSEIYQLRAHLQRFQRDETHNPLVQSMMIELGSILLGLESYLRKYTNRIYPLTQLQEFSPFVLACLRAKTNFDRQQYMASMTPPPITQETLNRRFK